MKEVFQALDIKASENDVKAVVKEMDKNSI